MPAPDRITVLKDNMTDIIQYTFSEETGEALETEVKTDIPIEQLRSGVADNKFYISE